MARLYLVRHGRAAAGWDHSADPDLDDVGRDQAAGLAERLAPLGPLPILVSPLQRTRSTAAPLEARWRTTATIDPAVGEIPSPPGVPMTGRTGWLREAMAGTWAELEPDYQAWRDAVVDRLRSVESDTVVVSHFIAINAAIGAGTGQDRVVCVALDNCSCTVMDVIDGRLQLIEQGDEAPDTLVR